MREKYKPTKNQFQPSVMPAVFKGAPAFNAINYGFMERLLIIKVNIADI